MGLKNGSEKKITNFPHPVYGSGVVTYSALGPWFYLSNGEGGGVGEWIRQGGFLYGV
jgi:hypothetical protein